MQNCCYHDIVKGTILRDTHHHHRHYHHHHYHHLHHHHLHHYHHHHYHHYQTITFPTLPTAYQKAVREQRMRTEISQAKREANFYLENVDKNKAFKAMEKRRKKKNSEDINTKVGRFYKWLLCITIAPSSNDSETIMFE